MISSPLNPDFRAEARYILTEIEQQREFIPAPGKCVIADGVHRLLDVVETFVRGVLGTDVDLDRIAKELREGMPIKELAVVFGVSEERARRLVGRLAKSKAKTSDGR